MMTPLSIGPLSAVGHKILRSGIRWLCKDGQHCSANEVIGYCNVSLERTSGRYLGPSPFHDEMEIQVCFAARIDGHIHFVDGAGLGGYLDIRESVSWEGDTVIGEIEADASLEGIETPGDLRLLILAGRRMTPLADVHSGLLPGWLGRSRAWWSNEDETPLTLLSLGICDATSLVLGDRCAFLELFAAMPFAAHISFIPDHPIAPAVPVLLDQLRRTSSDLNAIAADIRGFMSSFATPPTADDWIFVGTLLSVMGRNPIEDRYSVFTGSGMTMLEPAQAILLSLSAEPNTILRHRSLGFHLHIMRHHQAAAGPAARAWLAASFDMIKRSTSDIGRDYETLIDLVGEKTGAKIVVLNRMSTSGHEDISNYSPFDAPMSDTLANVGSKEQNLTLHEISERRELFIIDVDAAAAELGGAHHLPDGIHQSGAMQARLRDDLITIFERIRESI
jgi:hypothetical protein